MVGSKRQCGPSRCLPNLKSSPPLSIWPLLVTLGGMDFYLFPQLYTAKDYKKNVRASE
jgi:hypothetical protein